MRSPKNIPVRLFVFFLFPSILFFSGCTESTRRIRPLVVDTPAYSSDGIGADADSSLSHKTSKEMTSAGFAYLAAGNSTMARMHFISALKKSDSNPWAYIGLGDINYHAGDYLSALANYNKAASLDESNLAAILGQAQSLRQQGKTKDAMEKVERAKGLGPDDVRVLTEQAINYDLQGKESLAAPIYQEIAIRTPDQAAAFNNIGINEMSQGRYPEAISNFSKAYMLDGKDVRIANNLAMAFALYGQTDQALKLFSKTVGEAAAWNNLGYIFMTQGKFNEAEKALNKAIELNPKFYERAQENLDRLEQMRLANNLAGPNLADDSIPAPKYSSTPAAEAAISLPTADDDAPPSPVPLSAE